MKKYLFAMLAILPIILFTSCSSDDDKTENKKLSYVQFKFHFTPYKSESYTSSKKIYTKDIFLFRLEGKKIKEPISPYSMETIEYGKVCKIDDVNNEYIFADYAEELAQLKNDNGYYTFDLLAPAIYNYNFHGKGELQRGEHLLVVKIDGSYFCKKININPKGDSVVYEFNLTQTGKGDEVNRNIWF